MPRCPCTFKEADVKRAVKVLERMGKKITGLKVTAQGFEVVTSDETVSGAPEVTEWIKKHEKK